MEEQQEKSCSRIQERSRKAKKAGTTKITAKYGKKKKVWTVKVTKKTAKKAGVASVAVLDGKTVRVNLIGGESLKGI